MSSKKQTQLINLWKAKGFIVVNLITTNTNGIPDLLALKDGQAVFIESKEPGDSVKALQRYRMNELTKQGFDCYINEQPFAEWKAEKGYD